VEDRKQGALERGERGVPQIRAALGLDPLPAVKVKILDELMDQPRFSDAGIAGQVDRSAHGGAVLGRAPQSRRFPGAADEARDVARLAQPPALKVAGARDPINRDRIVKTPQRLAAEKLELDMAFGKAAAGFG